MTTKLGLRSVALSVFFVILASFLIANPLTTQQALASHLRGGLVTAEYHPAAGGHAQEEVHLVATMLATTASPDYFGNASVYRIVSGSPQLVSGCSGLTPSNSADTSSNPLFSINTSTYTIREGTGCEFTPGDYIFTASNGARISGIDNPGGYSSNVQFETRLTIDGVTESSAPTYSAGYMYNIAYSPTLTYSTNMNGLGQGNSTVTYELITSTLSSLGGYGAGQIPCSNLNTSTGVFSINSSLCTSPSTIANSFGSGQLYALKVKATDSRGQYSTRDVLLQFANTSNNAPVFSSTNPAPGPISVTPGSTQTITVAATDVDADVLNFTENLSKAWITESSVTTSGSGASTIYSKTYTLAPPAGTNETLQFEISVFDDDTFSLSNSIQYDIEAGGVLPPGVPGTPVLTSGPSTLSAVFTAPTTGGTVASYRADATPTAGGSAIQTACQAPPTPCVLTGLSAEAEYSVVIVATNASGSATSSAATETTLAGTVTSQSGGGGSVTPVRPSPLPLTDQRPRQLLPTVQQLPTPGPILQNNQVSPAPTAPTVSINGIPSQVQTLVTDPNNLNIRTGVLNIGINVQQNEGLVRQGTNGETEVQVRKGGVTGFQGGGLAPNTFVQVFLPLQGNNSKELARIPVDETGNFSGEAVFQTGLQDAPLPIGRQVLQMVTVDEQGRQNVVEITVNIVQPAPAPEINRENGQTPQLLPGQSLATNGGVPEVVDVIVIPDEKQTIIEGDGWTMGITPNSDGSNVTETEDGNVLLELVRDESATVSGSGFMPNTRADVWLFSEPTLLGTVEIDENGEFNGTVSIDGQVIAVGEHTLQMQGVGEDGYVRAANLGVMVNDEDTASSTEEAASGLLWWLLGGAAALSLATAGTVWWRRRAA